MINQIDKTWWFKINGATRKSHVIGPLSGICHNIVITEYPKSGGTWLSQMLSEALDVPYPRNRLPMLSESIIHGCFLKVSKNNTPIVLVRDGRDVMVSFYYHLMMFNSLKSSQHVKKVRSTLNFNDIYDIESNLPKFMELIFEKKIYPRFSWSEFIETWLSNDTVFTTSYENLQKDAANEVVKIIRYLSIERNIEEVEAAVHKYKFENVTNRDPGEEDVDSFVRKGIVGDWKNHFNKESKSVFNANSGNALVLAGYEEDSSWASN